MPQKLLQAKVLERQASPGKLPAAKLKRRPAPTLA
jgi:hypothetical protein